MVKIILNNQIKSLDQKTNNRMYIFFKPVHKTYLTMGFINNVFNSSKFPTHIDMQTCVMILLYTQISIQETNRQCFLLSLKVRRKNKR